MDTHFSPKPLRSGSRIRTALRGSKHASSDGFSSQHVRPRTVIRDYMPARTRSNFFKEVSLQSSHRGIESGLEVAGGFEIPNRSRQIFDSEGCRHFIHPLLLFAANNQAILTKLRWQQCDASHLFKLIDLSLLWTICHGKRRSSVLEPIPCLVERQFPPNRSSLIIHRHNLFYPR